jgi:RNA polymerase sigma factor (sigma-70 family)
VLEDRFLISKLRQGSSEALCRIYEKHRDDLLRLAMSLANDAAAPEDIVHDVFVSFIHQARQFELTGSLKSYLATCVANRARNVNRAQRVRSAVPLD